MKKIAVVTGTRAEYGLLKPVIKRITEDESIELCLIVTGMHLSEEFGHTYKEIEQDGFHIDYKNDMHLLLDTPRGICTSMGIGLDGFGDIFAEAVPDLVLLLGDRYEILLATIAAMMYNIPVAHIHGGELTEGAMDDAIRHSVTKMSRLHFASTQKYRKRIIQLGENPEDVYCVGALGVENIRNIQLLSKEQITSKFLIPFDKPFILVTYHPVTLEKNSAKEQFENLLVVVSERQDVRFVFTYANADAQGKTINKMIDDYVKNNENGMAFPSMGQQGYLSALKYASLVLGNSSSGIIEAPSFGVPTVNIGNRQAGRIQAESVINCGYEIENIREALLKAMSDESVNKCKNVCNPYEGVDTSEEIYKKIKEFVNSNKGVKKKFFDIEVGSEQLY